MKLSEYLAREGLKPTAFAERIKVPASTITRFLRGERKPGFTLMQLIERATSGEVSALDDFDVSKSKEAAE